MITLLGVCSVYAQENDWVQWQKKFFQTNADKADDHETAHFWRTQEPHIKGIRVTATMPDYPWVKVSGYKNRLVERCITCHDGISTVSPSHPPEFGCTVCHGGEPESVDKNQAHATLIYDPQAGTGKRNPSSFSVVEQSCGQLYCHSGHEREDRNHIKRLNKSMMNTLAGVISGLRYQWAGQNEKTARYATKAIQDEDGEIPSELGALEKLDQLPYSTPLGIPESDKNSIHPVSKHPADRLLRQRCFQCHIDSPPPPGEYRSQGCAACHFTYSNTGLYEGNDPTISKTEPGHSKFHRLQALPKRRVCVQCHKGFSIQPLGNEPSPGKNIKTPLILEEKDVINETEGPLETEDSTLETPPTEEISKKEITAMEINQEKELSLFAGRGNVQGDVHTARGMDCIDCHTQRDIMGDGNLYSKQHQAVEIRCETCHGDDNTYPMILKVTDPKDEVIRLGKHYKGPPNSVGDWMAVTERKNRMTNVKVLNGEMVVLGKKSGRAYKIPLTRDAEAHFIPQHRSRLECTACHSNWVVQCEGCHASINFGQDRLELKTADKPPIKIQQPALMIGPRGKVAPMLAQPERHFSLLDEKGNPIPALGSKGQSRGKYKEWHFTNPNSKSGSNLAYSLNPHSTSRKVRSCESCHLSPKTLGLGEGDLNIGANNTGKNDFLVPVNRSDQQVKASDFDPQAKVSMRGEILAGSHQLNARPFNQKEIVRILKVGNCIPCHDQYNDPIYQDIKKSYSFEGTLEHRQLREKILNSRQTQP
ncbi:MAG: hypothetical protein H8E32_05920 [Nitrospinae bacterium]|nr:hypothetical protein [Nitrospinota bacterium]